MIEREKGKEHMINELVQMGKRVAAELEALETKLGMTEDALQESEERYRSVFENALVPIIIEDYSALKAAIDDLKSKGVKDFRKYLDENSEFIRKAPKLVRVVEANEAALTLIEARDKKDLVDLPARVTLPETQEMNRGAIIALAEEKTNFETETVMQTLKGERKHILFKLTIPKQANSSTWVVSWIDFTERKQAELAMRESEERFSTFMDHLPGRVFMKDHNLNLIYVNKFINEVSGERDWLNKPLHEFFPKETADRFTASSRKALVEGLQESLETIPDKDNIERTYRKFEFPIPRKGKPPILGGIAVDITKQVEAEEALRRAHDELELKVAERTAELVEANKELKEQTKRNELILQTTLDGFLILDMDGRILVSNQAAANLFGYSQKGLRGMNIRELEVNDTKKSRDYVNRVIEKGAYRFESRLRRKSGQVIDLEVSTNFIEKDKEKFFFSFFRDITKRKQAEKELKEREEELEAKNINLEEMNSALKILLERREKDKLELEEKVTINVKQLVMPFLERLKNAALNERQKAYAAALESNLQDIISPFTWRLSSSYLNLTPMQLEVADLIRQGRTSKEIAEIMSLSIRSIEKYRDFIRGKLGIKNKKVNLRTHLLSYK